MRAFLITVAAANVCTLTGCMAAAKQAYYEFRGAKADIALNSEISDDALMHYQAVRFMPATTTLSPKLCPSSVKQSYDRNAAKLTTELNDLYPGGGQTLSISSEIQYYEEKGLLGAAMLLVRVRINDGSHLIVDALVFVRSKSFRDSGVDGITKAAIDGVAKFLREGKGESGSLLDALP
ncbi:MAG: hypothetical protein JXO22_11465 [Phycisphaerae bacterium]|nr:hypothetical protein [Phycisphaerae bacterium]